MARKVLFRQTGSADVLRIEEVVTPAPAAGEVRICVRAIGINRSEVNLRAGTYGQPPAFPMQLGMEASGEIDAVGPGVTGFIAGDAVSVLPAFVSTQYGMYGDLVLAPTRAVVKHPSVLSWEEAAATWMQFATAWAGLIDIANLAAGDTVLITAASSSVGLAAIQVSRRTGAIPIALTRCSNKAAALRVAGVEHVIATEEQDVQEEVMRLTRGTGARIVFDAVGGSGFSKLIASTAINGVVIVYGVLSKEVNALPAIHVLRRRLTIRGFGVPSVLENDAKLASMKKYVIDGLESGAFRPKIAKTFSFDKIAEAHRYLESNDQLGKVVITV